MTKNNLVIVESPAKAKTIGRYLGNGYTVKASMGHVRDCPRARSASTSTTIFSRTTSPSRARRKSLPI